MGVSGCPRSCVESGVKDFGVISVENGFQIYIGGNGGTEVTKGQFLTTVATEDEVIKLCGALMQYYRETGVYAERTAPWLERLGFDNVKAVLLILKDKMHYIHVSWMRNKQFQKNLGKQLFTINMHKKSLKLRRCKTMRTGEK